MAFALHPAVAALECLLGTWSGEGEGRYPTIEPFTYDEDITFGHVGKPFLSYRQATVLCTTGQPAHAEAGYLRGVADGRVELVVAQPSGVAEVSAGELTVRDSGVWIHLRTTQVVVTPTAKDVASVERTITVDGDTLFYDLAMGAVGQPHQHHLEAELRRVG